MKDFECDFINLSTSRSVNEIGIYDLKKTFRFVSSFIKTFWKLLTKKYDICYIALTCHGNGFIKDAPFALLCKLFNKKLVIHQHNKGMGKDLGNPWRVKLLRTVYKNATVILLSWKLYPDVEAIVRREQIKICPNGIPIDPLFNTFTNRNNTVPHLLFLSNLIPTKGVYILLDALKILKDRGYKYICNFVGGESSEISADTFNHAVLARGLNENVEYLGKKYNKEKSEILAKHDIFVFPTFYDQECFPVVLLEAMQAGLPCISTDEGAIPDLLGDTGIVIETQNVKQVADAIEKLIVDKDLYNTLSQRTQRRFHDNYTINSFERNISTILSNI